MKSGLTRVLFSAADVLDARDFPDLVKLLRLESKIDLRYIEQWAERLDDSMGGDEVRTRLQSALTEAKRSAVGPRRRPPRR